MIFRKFASMALAGLLMSLAAHASEIPRTASPEGATVYIVSPAHGETVDSTFTVIFGLDGMGVAPAGIDKANTGHHHLLIDGDGLPPGKPAHGYAGDAFRWRSNAGHDYARTG